tara:strand:+ start:414 stop:1376 length:963 start_codon:yes stop_codon:yes gene_type:complete
MGVKPITSRAAGSCVKNSLLKQTVSKDKPTDITTQTGNITTVSESNTPISTAGNYNIIGDKTTKNIKNPGTKGTTETKKRLSYREAYDQDIEGVRTGGGYKDFNAYVAGREGQRKKDPKAFEADMVAATGVSGGPGEVTITTPGTPESSTPDSETTPDYETVKGSGTLDVRGDFRRGQIAQRTSGKMAKKALRFDKKADRLEKRGKTKKAEIYRNKAIDSKKTSDRIRAKQDQFDIQENQGGTGTSSYATIKTRESIDSAKRRISGGSTGFTDAVNRLQNAGSTSSSNESSSQIQTPDLAKKLGFFDASSLLKKNYFKNK